MRWRVMQNLKKNWFVVSKMARIWWILIRARKSLKKIYTLIGPFRAKYITFDLKKYRKVATNVQNFRLSTGQVKFHQIDTLIGFFCWKYVKFYLKQYRGVMSLMTQKSYAKFEEKQSCCFKNDKNLVIFDPSIKKSQKFALWLVPFVQSL